MLAYEAIGRQGIERIEECISFLIGKAAQQITRRTREKLSHYGVTPRQYAVLKVLWEGDGMSAAEIGSRLVIDSATITGLVDRLEATELLERRAILEDRRVQQLVLTEKGRSLQSPLDTAMDQLNDEIAEMLGPLEQPLWAALKQLGNVKG